MSTHAADIGVDVQARHRRVTGGRHRAQAPVRAGGMPTTVRDWLVAVAVVAAVVAVAGIGSTAHAYWSSQGMGSGASSTGSASSTVTLSAGTATGALRPGGSVALSTTATNPNDAPLRIASLVLDTSRGSNGFTISGNQGACAASWFAYAPSSTGWTVPANGSATISLPGSLAMSTSAPSGCQGATVTVFLRAGA